MIIRARRHEMRAGILVTDLSQAPRALCQLRNVSLTGVLLSGLTDVVPGDRFGFEIPAARRRGRIVFVGEVRWTRHEVAGVLIVGMLPRYRERYDDLLVELKSD